MKNQSSTDLDQRQAVDSNDKDMLNLLPAILAPAGIQLSRQQLEAFVSYSELLRDWNTRINLTSITDNHGVAVRHFLDSLSLLPILDKEAKLQNKAALSLIDVGTGAGFPGLPLRVVRPELKLTLLDSLQKRINFLTAVISELELTGVLTISSRAEDAAHDSKYREYFDIAVARAVGPLPVLCEYLLPFVRQGGLMVAMKAQKNEEIDASAKAIRVLGGHLESVDHFVLPGSDLNRTLICVRKTGSTPPAYPRKAGTPGRKPII
ncbi:MAG: 16S rRNA (guanine(527)-N(7))-methyltransferase RsmG [Saccharofermentanales bacterium]|jgi:16S rRNA (guanine527-N7)-methyltransferase